MVPCKSVNVAVAATETSPVVLTAPVVLYSVIMANESTTEAALAGVYDGAGSVCVLDMAVPATGSVVWTGCVALPKGLSVICEAGAVRATVMYV